MITFGLRSRFIGAILVTSAVTLAAAAVALLSPLQRSLRQDELDTLHSSAAASKGQFSGLSPDAMYPRSPALAAVARSIARRTESRILIGTTDGRVLYDPTGDHALASSFRLSNARQRSTESTVRDDGSTYAVVAERTGGSQNVVFVLQRSLDEASSAAGVVQRAFVVASAFALFVGLLLGAGLVTTLLGRLRRLRNAVGRVTTEGLEAEIPADYGRDEIADLTQAFRSMQEALRRQEESRRKFVATASHELRTPITSLHGMLELLDSDLAAGAPNLPDARLQLAGARRQTARLVALTRDLLDLSRLDAGTRLRREPVELVEVARAVLAEFELAAQGAEVELLLEPRDEPCWALADPGSVARIVRILVDNALRYSPRDAPVRVGVCLEGGSPRVTVADAGRGVAPQDVDRVFERFSRGTGATSDDGGFGLGLAIGRELARQMGGDLGLVRGSGGGACFALMLPAAEAEEVSGAPEEPGAAVTVGD